MEITLDERKMKEKGAIKSAELLPDEGDFDTSISRAYCAMFYATEALLLTKDLKFCS